MVVVADLVARVRSEGVQEAATQVKAVGQEAATTARALEIMAAQFAKLHGGTAADALTMFQKSGAQPTAAAMAEAAKSAERTAAAVSAAIAPTQAVARAAVEHSQGWTASESSLVRFGTALVGVNLGISLVAGAARALHGAIVDIIDGQIAWERSIIQVKGLYGELAPQIERTALAQANLPGSLSGIQENIQSAINARFLASRYGLPQQSITDLTTSGVRLAGALGLSDPAARAQLQAQLLQGVESGGSGLRTITGTELDPLSVSRQLGGVSAAQTQALTPAQLNQARALMISIDANQMAATATGEGSLLSRRSQVESALQRAQSNLRSGLASGTQGNEVYDPMSGMLVGTNASMPSQADATRLTNELKELTDELGTASEAAAKARGELETLGVTAGSAAFRLLGFTGSIEDRYSIARGDIGAQAQAAVTARARSAFPARAMSNQEIGAVARGGAAQSVYQNYVAEQAQSEQANAVRDYLQSVVQNGSASQRASAGRALDELPRRQAAGTVTGQANRAGDLANRAGTEADAQLQAISLRSEERRLSVAQELAGYRREVVGYEAQMAPLLNQQATLQDRMTVAARDNLTSRRALIQAEQQALTATNVTSAYDYQAQRLELRAEQSRAIVRQGGAPTEDISALRQEYRGLELQRSASGADLAALDAQRGVQVVGQQRTGEQLGRDLTLTNLEGQQRALEDQLIPMTELARLAQAKQDVISRTLELQDLEDTKARTAAQEQQNAAAQLRLTVDEIARQADDYANGLNLGATASERAQTALEKARDAIKETVPLLRSLTTGDPGDREHRGSVLAAGNVLSAGGIPGGSLVLVFNGSDRATMQQQIGAALDQFFAGAATTGSPAPATVGGAGR